MAEIQTPQEDKKFNGRAVGAAGAILGVGITAAWAGGSAHHNQELAQDHAAQSQAETAAGEAYHDSIVEAINAQYDQSDLVGNVNAPEGGSLGEEGLALVETALGSDVYDDIKDRIYSPLMDSSAQYIPQPNETFSVVEVDINPEANDGDEYVLVKPDHVVNSNITELPTPETH
jgi:hypothetical protein